MALLLSLQVTGNDRFGLGAADAPGRPSLRGEKGAKSRENSSEGYKPKLVHRNVAFIFKWDKNGIKIGRATLLHIACFSGAFDCVKYLLQNGADVSVSDDEGRTPLYLASMAGFPQIVQLLISSNADPNAKDKNGWSPLHRAALWGHAEIVRILVNSGANINATEEANWTPLHLAVKWNRLPAVEALLELGANVSIKSEGGKLPLNLAEEYQLSKIANLLRKAQGEQAIKAALAAGE